MDREKNVFGRSTGWKSGSVAELSQVVLAYDCCDESGK